VKLGGMDWEARFRRHAGFQEGILARFQVPLLGCTPEHWQRARNDGRWEPWGPRILLEAGLPRTDHRRALAGVLDSAPGSMLHAEAALGFLGMKPFDLRRILVARPRGLASTPATLGELHLLRAVRARDVIVVRGVPTETALRAIWAIAARYASPGRVDIGYLRIARLLDAANRMNLVTWAALHEAVDDLQQRGRAGTVLMRALAEERLPGTSKNDSRQEVRLEELLDEAGEKPLRRQIVSGGDEPIGRCDHRDHDLPLVIETNSETFHTTPTDQLADEIRHQRFNVAGFTVGVVWEQDLWSNPRGAIETVRTARRHARARRADVVHSPGCPWTTSYLRPDLAG
jgi:hypothetical protein